MRKAFTFIELVFVIVIVGILAKFGTNILLTAYTSYAQSSNNNKLLADTELTLKILSNRLQYRIRDSVIVRDAAGFSNLAASNNAELILEWVGYDIDGWLGSALSTNPNWSGFIDVNNIAAFGAKTYLQSPGTDTAITATAIENLSPGPVGTSIANAAIFFTGANSDVTSDYGWDGATQNNHSTTAAHRIRRVPGIANLARLGDGTLPLPISTFNNTDIYENYKLAWTAYAVSLEDGDGDGIADDLVLYYDYQPWEGEAYDGATSTRVLLLQNADTFKFRGIGDSIMLQICTSDNDALGAGDGGYSVCEETTIF